MWLTSEVRSTFSRACLGQRWRLWGWSTIIEGGYADSATASTSCERLISSSIVGQLVKGKVRRSK